MGDGSILNLIGEVSSLETFILILKEGEGRLLLLFYFEILEILVVGEPPASKFVIIIAIVCL